MVSDVPTFVSCLLFGFAGIAIGISIGHSPEVKQIPTKQSLDTDRYYCHQTGFLMHHWEPQKGKGNWMDTLVTNRWDEPIKCEEK